MDQKIPDYVEVLKRYLLRGYQEIQGRGGAPRLVIDGFPIKVVITSDGPTLQQPRWVPQALDERIYHHLLSIREGYPAPLDLAENTIDPHLHTMLPEGVEAFYSKPTDSILLSGDGMERFYAALSAYRVLGTRSSREGAIDPDSLLFIKREPIFRGLRSRIQANGISNPKFAERLGEISETLLFPEYCLFAFAWRDLVGAHPLYQYYRKTFGEGLKGMKGEGYSPTAQGIHSLNPPPGKASLLEVLERGLGIDSFGNDLAQVVVGGQINRMWGGDADVGDKLNRGTPEQHRFSWLNGAQSVHGAGGLLDLGREVIQISLNKRWHTDASIGSTGFFPDKQQGF